MGEMISGFFGMIWALIGVIFQLAGPVAILIIVCLIIKKVLIDPASRNFIDYISGVNPRVEKQREKRINAELKQYHQNNDKQNDQEHRQQIKDKINRLQNELKQDQDNINNHK